LASLKVTVESRADAVQSDLKERAEDIDARHPGSTFVQELVSYGKYFFLVLGPFATSRVIANPLWISWRWNGPCTLSSFEISNLMSFSMQKRALIGRIGLFVCRGWAQHFVDCLRDAVSSGSSSSFSDNLISFRAIFPLISSTAVLSAALICLVLKQTFLLLAFVIPVRGFVEKIEFSHRFIFQIRPFLVKWII